MNRFLERASFAISRPDLLLRKIQGKDLIDIELHEIAPYLTDSPVILEAGACDGTDTVMFAKHWPDATIYAFEPIPELFAETERRTSRLSQVRRSPLALSARTGSATMYVSEGEKGNENRGDSSSLLTPAEHLAEFRRSNLLGLSLFRP